MVTFQDYKNEFKLVDEDAERRAWNAALVAASQSIYDKMSTFIGPCSPPGIATGLSKAASIVNGFEVADDGHD
jgi:hypothetical protein